jgi:HD superfamily phosphohydrolase
MDYLKRDSFYSGVAEGNINSDRLIQMLNVYKDELVIEEKGIYSIEKFLMARRLMYWQTYLHKTSVAAEIILTKILKRAKFLTQNGIELAASQPLTYFLQNRIESEDFNDEVLSVFSQLDDFDIISAIKSWLNAEDYILRKLSEMIIHRDLPKIQMSNQKFDKKTIRNYEKDVLATYPISNEEVDNCTHQGVTEWIHDLPEIIHNPVVSEFPM